MSTNEVISILILEGGIDYIYEPAKLNKDCHRVIISEEIKETKITINNHLIITFYDQNGCYYVLANSKGCVKGKQVKELNKKKKNEDVIKGLNYKTIESYWLQLSQMGISKIMQINKISYKMVRAECVNEEAKDQFVINGIKLGFFSLKV